MQYEIIDISKTGSGQYIIRREDGQYLCLESYPIPISFNIKQLAERYIKNVLSGGN